MKFDYTKGKEARYKVSVNYCMQNDFYYFSEFEGATALYNKVVEKKEENLSSVVLRDLSKKGVSAVLARYSTYDELRDSNGLLLAYYDAGVIYILSSAILPPRGASRQEIKEAFDKTIEQRLKDYATEEHKTLITEFTGKHAKAKVSEYSTIY